MHEASSAISPAGGGPAGLLVLYDRALPQVFGYLVRRCGTDALAEDLTSEVFMAAATALRSGAVEEIGVPWLIGTARHKLIDHWRRNDRQRRAFSLLATDESTAALDPQHEPIATRHAHEVLEQLNVEHRSALTLRYIDGLAVDEVAAGLGRSLHATESLLQRAKAAFRQVSAEQRRSEREEHDHG
jgi:RNA polymerase sigma-70 factor (ECF subfamily)